MAVNRLRSSWPHVIVIALLALGCESSSNSGGGASLDDMANAMEAKKTAKVQQEKSAKEAEERAAQQAAAPPAAAEEAEPAPLETVTARSPKKGQSLEGGGYLSVVTGTRFWAEHQLILDNVRHAMDLYQAEHGNFPKDQDEFMKNIIEANSIKLPELPEGYEYVYDTEEPLVLKMRNTGTGDPNAIQ